jgi:hypothetical protein
MTFEPEMVVGNQMICLDVVESIQDLPLSQAGHAESRYDSCALQDARYRQQQRLD